MLNVAHSNVPPSGFAVRVSYDSDATGPVVIFERGMIMPASDLSMTEERSGDTMGRREEGGGIFCNTQNAIRLTAIYTTKRNDERTYRERRANARVDRNYAGGRGEKTPEIRFDFHCVGFGFQRKAIGLKFVRVFKGVVF